MELVIAEKPSVAKAIAPVLGANKNGNGCIEGNGYIVSWCFGHLLGLYFPEDYDEKLKEWSFETLPIIPEKWRFKILKNCGAQYKILKCWLDELALKEAMKDLLPRERNILYLRFFKGATQVEAAKAVGISQAQVSRLEKGALDRIKRLMNS